MTQGSGMRMPGEMLAAARQAADLSLARVSDMTKIPPASLEAIERDEYHKISGDLYVKSFLRLYAETVNLDPEDVMDAYRRLVGEVSLSDDGEEAPAWSVEEVQVKGIGLPWHRILPVAAVVVAAVVALVFFRGCGDETPPRNDVGDERPAVVEPPVVAATPADSLAEEATGTESGTVAEMPVPDVPSDGENDGAATETPPPAAIPPAVVSGNLSPAPAGLPELGFSSDREFPLVLRVICDRPQDLRVQVDGTGVHLPVFWPAAGTRAPSIPSQGPVPGQAYAVREGFVVFWGGEDHFSLVFERLGGVSVTTNGENRELDQVRPGQEWILDVHPPGYFVRP